tara:strand:+ start:281 stop:733 length:453 start_codon:yes stop_codon:yes gene_type:complete
MFKTYKNILNKNQRQKLLKFIKNELQDLGGDFPELQTKPFIHQKDDMKYFIKAIAKYIKPYKIDKCWGVFSEGKIIAWHNHLDCKYSFVYYLLNTDKAGTMFLKKEKYYDKIKYSEGDEDTLIKFDGSLTHSTPNTHKNIKRYTIAFDVI